jgi:serine/threonine-protein kinase
MHEALRCFEQSIAQSPDFSPPHAGIAYALVAFGIYYALRPRDAFPRAREAADRALAIDPTDALALVMRAHTALWYEWDLAGAEASARRALELAPGLYLAHQGIGFVLAAKGDFESAIAAMQQARSLDPLSEYATADLAWILILAGRWQQAIRELEPAIARHPQASELRRAFGFCLFYAGRLHDARAEFTHVLELNVGDRWGSTNLVQALAALGDVGEARRLVGEIEQRAPHEPIPPLGIAIMHHWLGDDHRALEWLERSIEARDYWLVMMRFDPSMARLRGNPRFEALLNRVRVAPPDSASASSA